MSGDVGHVATSISPNSDNVPAASSHYLSIYQGSNCLTIFSLTSDLWSKNSHSVTSLLTELIKTKERRGERETNIAFEVSTLQTEFIIIQTLS